MKLKNKVKIAIAAVAVTGIAITAIKLVIDRVTSKNMEANEFIKGLNNDFALMDD